MAKDGGGFLAGVVIGGILGAALAFILTSSEDDETLQPLREKGIELKGKLEELEKKGKELLDEQVARVEEAVNEGKDAAQKKRDEMMAQFEAEKTRPPQEVPETP